MNWGSVADWASGIGSLSAAIVALYVAHTSSRVRLRGYCGYRLVLGAGTPTIEIVNISVTNVSRRTTTVTNIGLSLGMPFLKRHGIISVMQSHISHGIPKTLNDGESATWSIELDKSYSWLQDLVEKFKMTWLSVQTLRFHVYTSNGGTTTLRPGRNCGRCCLSRSPQKSMANSALLSDALPSPLRARRGRQNADVRVQ